MLRGIFTKATLIRHAPARSPPAGNPSRDDEVDKTTRARKRRVDLRGRQPLGVSDEMASFHREVYLLPFARAPAGTTHVYRLITSVVPAGLLVVPELRRLFLWLMWSRLGVTTVSIDASHLDQFVVQTEQQKCRRPLTHEGAGVLAPRELQTERKPDRTHRRPEVHVGRYLRCLLLDASSD